MRGLRARLSYASYKAANNIPHVPLNDLEAKSRALSAAPPHLIGSKRKASGAAVHSTTQAPAMRRGGSASSPVALAPTNSSTTRSIYSSDVQATLSNATHSLYTALLGPPPLKQARTVRNSADPPVPAASRSTAGSRPRQGHRGTEATSPTVRSIAESTRAQSRNRQQEARRSKGSRIDKGKRKASAEETAAVERQAVATLTSLLQSRPSVASVSSPRSSLSTMSDSGSFQSFNHYGQSSCTATVTNSLLPPAEASFTMSHTARAATPPRSGSDHLHTTPRASDEEAANLMLYLHTSPSPARPTTTRDRDTRDLATFRTLGGAGSLRSKGRVLFAGAEGGNSPLRSESSFTADNFPASQSPQLSQPLRLETSNDKVRVAVSTASLETTVIPPTPESQVPPSSQQFPSPPSPSRAVDLSNISASLQAPPTPGNMPFNLNDFINVSPSPAPTTVPRSTISLRSGLGANLRADLGRKLFEEDQHRHHPSGPGPGAADGLRNGAGSGVLGASIDLVDG